MRKINTEKMKQKNLWLHLGIEIIYSLFKDNISKFQHLEQSWTKKVVNRERTIELKTGENCYFSYQNANLQHTCQKNSLWDLTFSSSFFDMDVDFIAKVVVYSVHP